MIKQFNSMSEIRDQWLECGKPQSFTTELSWLGNETITQTDEWSLTGNPNLVPEAEKLLGEIQSEIHVPRSVWTPSVAGAFACIPDHVRGLPTSMRRRVEATSDHEPINIIVGIVSSMDIKAETLHKRGVAILALALSMTAIRPVNLWTACFMNGNTDHTGETILTTKINTSPLDLASACYALTSQGFSRRMNYGLGRVLNGFTGGFPKGYGFDQRTNYLYTLPARLFPGLCTPRNTLVIDAARSNDELVTHPVQWINNQIQIFTQGNEE